MPTIEELEKGLKKTMKGHNINQMIIRNRTTNQHCLGRDAIHRVSALHSVLISYQPQIQFIVDECGDTMNGDAMNRISICCNVQDR